MPTKIVDPREDPQFYGQVYYSLVPLGIPFRMRRTDVYRLPGSVCSIFSDSPVQVSYYRYPYTDEVEPPELAVDSNPYWQPLASGAVTDAKFIRAVEANSTIMVTEVPGIFVQGNTPIEFQVNWTQQVLWNELQMKQVLFSCSNFSQNFFYELIDFEFLWITRSADGSTASIENVIVGEPTGLPVIVEPLPLDFPVIPIPRMTALNPDRHARTVSKNRALILTFSGDLTGLAGMQMTLFMRAYPQNIRI